MHDDSDDSPANERLARIWREGRREAVVTFLQRAITPDATLLDVFEALSFPEAQEHLASLRLQEILSKSSSAQRHRGTLPERTPQRDRGGHPAKRSPEEVQHMRDRLVDYLVETDTQRATTSELFGALRDEGLATAQVAVVQLIKGLEAEGVVQNMGGTPIVWKLMT